MIQIDEHPHGAEIFQLARRIIELLSGRPDRCGFCGRGTGGNRVVRLYRARGITVWFCNRCVGSLARTQRKTMTPGDALRYTLSSDLDEVPDLILAEWMAGKIIKHNSEVTQ